MRLSAFNHYVADYPEVGQTLVHNTFSGAYVVLDSDVVTALHKADRGEALTADEAELAGDPDLADPDVAVVVASRKQEEAEFAAWFDRKRRRPVLDVILGINLACNFDCPYCSQATVMDGTVMSEETCDATARWLIDRALAAGVDGVSLAFVGGEPLLHPGRIERIARAVKLAMEQAGKTFQFSLITNGYFLDEAMLDRLCPLGLAGAQVTLDGDETTHARTRVSKKGEDTFARIFGHVIAASRRIRISINGNYQTDTVHGFEPLLAKLEAAGFPDGSRVKFSPALEVLSAAAGTGSGACNFSNSDMSRQVALHDAAIRAGFAPIPLGTIGPCEFHDHHAFAIEPSGTIYKCPGFLGRPEWGIGDVRTGLGERYGRMLSLNPQRECGGCSHRPNCAGGCVAGQWIALGRVEGVNCEHGYFESVKRDATVRGYLLASADSPASAATQFPPPVPAAGEEATRARRSPSLRVIAA